MPCNCDHVESSARESESKTVATHLIYVNHRLGLPADIQAVHASVSCYGNVSMLDRWTAELCEKIRGMDDAQLSSIVYDGRDPKARSLADWWGRHQKADAELRAKGDALKKDEESRRNREELARTARGKLTDEEYRAIKGG